MLKVYKVIYPTEFWECQVEINEDFIVSGPAWEGNCKSAMEGMIAFWMGGNERLAENEGNVSKTFAQQLAREAYMILVERDLTLYGVIEEIGSREGWGKPDGSLGYKLIYVDDVEIRHKDFEVEEI
ncbi:Protein of unknown function [Pedobacter antarcticus]|nr:Protein of unknown function [Pedobacter antarcticus]